MMIMMIDDNDDMVVGKMRGPFKSLFFGCLDIELSETKLKEEHTLHIRNQLMHAASFRTLCCDHSP